MNQATTFPSGAMLRPVASASSTFGQIKRSYAVGRSDKAVPASSASNDSCFDPADSTATELDAWARHAAASNGFADVDAGSSAQPHHASLELYAAARGFSAAGARATLVAMRSSLIDQAKRMYGAWQRHRRAAATRRALDQLDALTLHDIGLDRSELHSIAGELTGEIDRTRAHALMTLRAHAH